MATTAVLLPLLASAAAPPPPAYSCEGHCGSWAEHCWCNDECEAHGDCCSDYEAACGGGGGGGGGGGAGGVLSTRHLLVGGYNRSFELQVPRNSTGKLPVILSFHGDGGYAASQAADDHFRDVAGAFAIVVHGQGIGTEQHSGKPHPTWNGGGSSMQSVGPSPRRIAPDGETCQQNITKGTLMVSCAKEIGAVQGDPCWWSNCLDDVAYVVAILDLLEAEYSVDTSKIFASGDSSKFGLGCAVAATLTGRSLLRTDGAMFLYQLIADPRTGNRLAAVAPVAGLPHNGFLFPPTNPRLRYLNIWGEQDTYIPAECPQGDHKLKSGPGCCGWYYSCIDNTTRLFASLQGFPPGPRALAAPLAAGAAQCRGYSKLGAEVSTAQVVDCSWRGPHGWPRLSRAEDARSGSATAGARWPAQMILDFFLAGEAPPPPPPPPAAACPDCGGKNCDGWIASDPEKYSCAELKRDWSCDCRGCKSCPNATHTFE